MDSWDSEKLQNGASPEKRFEVMDKDKDVVPSSAEKDNKENEALLSEDEHQPIINNERGDDSTGASQDSDNESIGGNVQPDTV